MGGQEASPSGQPADPSVFPPVDLHPGADGVAGASGSLQPEPDPGRVLAPVVAQQQRTLVEPDEQRVGVAVVVEVSRSQSPGRVTVPEDRPGLLRQIMQLPPAVIAQQQGRLQVGDVSAGQLNGSGDVAVDDDQVLVAVVVEVDEANAPAHVGHGETGESGTP